MLSGPSEVGLTLLSNNILTLVKCPRFTFPFSKKRREIQLKGDMTYLGSQLQRVSVHHGREGKMEQSNSQQC